MVCAYSRLKKITELNRLAAHGSSGDMNIGLSCSAPGHRHKWCSLQVPDTVYLSKVYGPGAERPEQRKGH